MHQPGDGGIGRFGCRSQFPVRGLIICRCGGMHDLGHLGNGIDYNPAINDLGQVVGDYALVNGGSSGFIWSQTTGMRDLKPLVDLSANRWSLGRSMSINNAGQIVGVGTDPSGFNEAFLLTPLPEPSSLFLLAIGGLTMGGAAVRRWRRRKRPATYHADLEEP